MTGTYVQVPPQSTGKKVATVSRTDTRFDKLTGGTITAVRTAGFADNKSAQTKIMQIFICSLER